MASTKEKQAMAWDVLSCAAAGAGLSFAFFALTSLIQASLLTGSVAGESSSDQTGGSLMEAISSPSWWWAVAVCGGVAAAVLYEKKKKKSANGNQ